MKQGTLRAVTRALVQVTVLLALAPAQAAIAQEPVPPTCTQQDGYLEVVINSAFVLDTTDEGIKIGNVTCAWDGRSEARVTPGDTPGGDLIVQRKDAAKQFVVKVSGPDGLIMSQGSAAAPDWVAGQRDDVITLVDDDGGARFELTGLKTKFDINVGNAPSMAADLRGDARTGGPVRLPSHFEGSPGRDEFYAGDGDADMDLQFGPDLGVGGPGKDRIYANSFDSAPDEIIGGRGADEVFGSRGADVIKLAGDGAADKADCRGGRDTGDADDLDELTNCEINFPAVSAADVRVGEAGPAVLRVTLSKAPATTTTVTLSTADGTAKTPGDYLPFDDTTKTVTFEPNGPLAKDVPLAVVDDDVAEGEEAFTVALASAQANPSGPATVTILDDDEAAAVAFTKQPQSQTVPTGSSVTFTVEVAGNPAPTLTWEVDVQGQNGFQKIPGETGTTLDVGTVDVNDNGTLYRAVARSSASSEPVYSDVAVLRVYSRPFFQQQPQDVTVKAGEEAVVTAEVLGAESLQWFDDRVGSFTAIPGATEATLRVPTTSRTDGRKVFLLARNANGDEQSKVATIHVQHAPEFTTQPASQSVQRGRNATFTAAVVANPEATLQWQRKAGDRFVDIPGATEATYTVQGVETTDDGAVFRVLATNALSPDGVASDEAVLTIKQGPVITDQPRNQTVTAGGDATFTVDVEGEPELQWQRKEGETFRDIPGATEKILVLKDVTAADDGAVVRVLARDGDLVTESEEATLDVQVPPSFTTQPANQEVAPGADATFTVAVAGDPAPTVRWERRQADGAFRAIEGADTTTLTLPGVTAQDDGAVVRAVASNAAQQRVESTVATLRVSEAPSITDQPEDAAVDEGQDATFEAEVAGTPAPQLQWEAKDPGGSFAPVPNQTTARLVLAKVADRQDGTLVRLRATNGRGPDAVSREARLTVRTAPRITTQPASVTVAPGQDATFTVAASGRPQPGFRWERKQADGSFREIAGAESATLTLPKVTAQDDGAVVRAVASNGVGEVVRSQQATLTVRAAPSITKQPQPQDVVEGEDATYTVEVAGTPVPTVRWQRKVGAEFVDIDGATGTTLTLPEVSRTDAGTLVRAVASSSAGEDAFSDPAGLTVRYAPAFTKQPAATTVDAGQDAVFEITTDGNPAPTVAWQRRAPGAGSQWETIPGEPTRLVLAEVGSADNGTRVRAILSNDVQSGVESAEAVLTVRYAPTVTDPQDTTVDERQTARFQVVVDSNPASSVQWQAKAPGADAFSDLEGKTEPTLELADVAAAQNGLQVRAVVTNGKTPDATSRPATLTVRYAPVVGAPEDQTAAEGEDATFTITVDGNPAPTIAWQRSAPGEEAFTTIEDEAGRTLVLDDVTRAQHGTRVRAIVTNDLDAVTTEAAALTVDFAPEIRTAPKDQTVDEGTDATFTIEDAGRPAPTVRWQRKLPGAEAFEDVEGATGRTFVVRADRRQDGMQVRAVSTNRLEEAVSEAATLTVQLAPQVTTAPADRKVTEGEDATFTVAVDGHPAPAIQWQRRASASGTFEDVAGATGPSLTIPGTTLAQDGTQVRVLLSNRAGKAESAPATLSVAAKPPAPQPQGGTAGAQQGGEIVVRRAPDGTPCINLAVLDTRRGPKGTIIVTGFAPPSAAGRRVTLLGDGKPVGTLLVQASGLFQGQVKRAGRYIAQLGGLVSRGLRVERRLVITKTALTRTAVEVTGQLVVRGRAPRTLEVTRQPLCGGPEEAGSIRMSRRGAFRAKLQRPSATTGPVVYRLSAEVAGARSFSVPLVVLP